MRKLQLTFLISIGVILLIAGWLAYLSNRIHTYSQVRDERPADVAIVLGAAVYRGRPSPVFRERIRHAVNLYHQEKVAYLIFTGGIGENDALAEAEVGRAYALQMGVPAGRTLIETESTLTYDNLRRAQQIVAERGFSRVLLVSDPLHMRRAVTMARDIGLNAYPSPTPTSRYRSRRTQHAFLTRETYYYATYLLARPWLF